MIILAAFEVTSAAGGFSFSLCPFLPVLWPVAAVDIYTPGSLEALNGTDVRLKCTFQSNYPVERLTVNWQFRPEATDQDEFVSFHLPFCGLTRGYSEPILQEFLSMANWDSSLVPFWCPVHSA